MDTCQEVRDDWGCQLTTVDLFILVALTGSVNWWLTDWKLKSYTSNVATLVDINMSIAFVWTAVGLTRRRSINFADTYELPAAESISARHLIHWH